MYKSIQHFLEKGIDSLEKTVEDFSRDPSDLSKLVLGVGIEINKLAVSMIGEVMGDINKALINSNTRKIDWTIERHEEATILTSLGVVSYPKTLFKSKKNGRVSCLLDNMLGIHPHERMSTDALARIYAEAVESSYAKGGCNVSVTTEETVSREAVKRKIHDIEFPEEERPLKRKKVKNLYVSADEDHISLQFHKSKGDLQTGENGRTNNNCISKLIYVYEGRELVSSGKQPRYQLEGIHYFSGIYEGSDKNNQLWEDVSKYIESNYEIAEDGHIYVLSDGGSWISKAEEVLGDKVITVMDRFHMEKYVNKAANVTGDSRDDYKEKMKAAIDKTDKEDVEGIFTSMQEYISQLYEGELYESERRKRLNKIRKSHRYIIGNWGKIAALNTYGKELHGCSAEGHVSHILSSRMSSRPMGWSKHGADRVSRLRAYNANGGSMLELARYQRQNAESNAKDVIKVNLREIRNSEKQAKTDLEKYFDVFQASLGGRTALKQASIMLSLNI